MLTIDLSQFPVLATERLVLRELRLSDADRVFAMRSDPAVMAHVSRPVHQHVDEAVALIALVSANYATNDAVQWAITVKGDDTFIGLIGFWRIVKEHHSGELGYMLAREHWGKGYISEAIGAVVPFGFHTLGFHRVEAITRPVNVASIRALEKNGFQREGLLKENIFAKGAFHDSLHFGRLAT